MEHILTKVRCGLSIVRKAKSYLNQESPINLISHHDYEPHCMLHHGLVS